MNIKNIFRHIYYYKYYSKFRKCGKNVKLSKQGIIARPEEISFGDNIFIGPRFLISGRDLKFGNNILIGPNLVIECDDHVFDRIGRPMFEYSSKRNIGGVNIENDVWMGANVTVLRDVTVGEGSVVGACSLITKNILPYTIAFGSPAKSNKLRFTPNHLKQHLNQIDSLYDYDQLMELYNIGDLL